MRILDRYILSQLGLPLALCLGGFMVFWVSGDLLATLEDFKTRNTHPVDIARYYWLKLPGYLDLLGPVAFLLSLLYGLIQMTRHHETTAMRASGVSLWRLSAPILIVGLVLGALSFSYREFLLVENESEAEEILNGKPDDATSSPATSNRNSSQSLLFYWNEQEGRRWAISTFSRADESIEFSDVDVEWPLSNGSRNVIFASSAKYSEKEWTFFGVTAYEILPGENAQLIPMLHQSLSVPVSTLPETPDFLLSQFKISRIEDVRDARKANFSAREIMNLIRLFPDMGFEDRRLLETKLHIQIATCLTYVVVALIAVPLGCKPGRRDVFIGVAISMGICFSYFVVQRISAPLGFSGKIPPVLAAWLPNILFGITGLSFMFNGNSR